MAEQITNCITENRVGKLRIRRDLLPELSDEALQFIFGQFVVVRAEYMFTGNYIEYIAYSPLFNVLPLASEPDLYDVILRNDEDGNIAFVGVQKSPWGNVNTLANDLARKTLDLPPDTLAPTFEERRKATEEALADIADFVDGELPV